ncbi:MAG: polymerase [Patescibacteria group bacterium]|jgi:repressor LexA|nr:polymerase [Patescibacteria group bacterium]
MEKHKNKIIKFYKKQRRMPSYSELMVLLGYRSKNAVFKLIKKLVEEGFISQDEQGHILPKQLYSQPRILGTVEAGFPSPAEEELSDIMSLEEYLIENKEATFILKVTGESMKDAGIMPGDMVLADRSATPRDGDIVIAEIDNAWTMKYLRVRNKKIFLEPANKKFKNIYPQQDLKIAAVVKGVVRKY